MCRHLAYLGPPATIQALVLDPPCGLAKQAWAPRQQRNGTMNVDGFGAGWYADGDPVPARYRRPGPIWADPCFADLARVTRTRALLAAVRSATEGTEHGVGATAPYREGRWLFSHNGTLNGWPTAAAVLAASLPAADLLALGARCDSALVGGLVGSRLRWGGAPADALAGGSPHFASHRGTGLNSTSPEPRRSRLLTRGVRVLTARGVPSTRTPARPHTVASPPSASAYPVSTPARSRMSRARAAIRSVAGRSR